VTELPLAKFSRGGSSIPQNSNSRPRMKSWSQGRVRRPRDLPFVLGPVD